jgi:hypothetical protein
MVSQLCAGIYISSSGCIVKLPNIVSRALCIRVHRSSRTVDAHARDVPAMFEKIPLESGVFVVDSVLSDLWQAEESEEGA